MDATIGARVREALDRRQPAATQHSVATAVGMTPDALSRALNGKRAFSSGELAKLAELAEVDVYWLITGEDDPQKLVYAARHDFDHESGRHSVPGEVDDALVLRDVELAYRQAEGLPATPPLAATPGELRAMLGDDFVRHFVERIEERLGVDVVRVAELSTAYCFTVDKRHVIAIRATGNWFHENWSLAHELGHLAMGHLDSGRPGSTDELAANSFAAELLMPKEQLSEAHFDTMSDSDRAQWVWDNGVSSNAAYNRLRNCRIAGASTMQSWSRLPTQRLLRYHWVEADPSVDAISERMRLSALRHFSNDLLRAHVDGVTRGKVGTVALAWMLGVAPEDFGLREPEPPSHDVEDLAEALGIDLIK